MSAVARPVLAVDIDEVLFPFTERYLTHYNAETGQSVQFEDLKTYFYVEQLQGIDDLDRIEAHLTDFLEHAMAERFGPYAGAVGALERLAEHYDVEVITSRHPENVALSERWLSEHFPDLIRQVHFIRTEDGEVTKAEVCKRIGAAVFIEDHPRYVLEAAAAGVRCLLFGDYPWNRDMPATANVERVKDWNEVLEVLL